MIASHSGRRSEKSTAFSVRGLIRVILTCIVCLGSVGCYTFRPASVETLVSGLEVRMRITGAFADSLGPLIMKEDARVFDAEVVSGTATSLLLEIPISQRLTGMRVQSLSQRIEIPLEALVEMELKELSKARTAGAVALIGGVATAIVLSQFNGDNGGAQQPGPGRPVESTLTMSLTALASAMGGFLFGR